MFGFFRLILLITVLLPVSASAGRVENNIVTQLQGQGFTQIQINRTWLGRSRIVARSKNFTREIVVNPATGAILRDYWSDSEGKPSGTHGLIDPEAISTARNSDDRSDDSGRENGGGDDAGDSGGVSESASNDGGDTGGGSENARGASDAGAGDAGAGGSDGGESDGGGEGESD